VALKLHECPPEQGCERMLAAGIEAVRVECLLIPPIDFGGSGIDLKPLLLSDRQPSLDFRVVAEGVPLLRVCERNIPGRSG